VSTEHDDDTARIARRGGDGIDHGAEVTRDEDVGECVEESAEGTIGAGRLREIASADLVGADRDGHGAYGGEIRFTVRASVGRYWLALVRAGAGRYDLRYRLRDPIFRPDFICSMM
jgi:hypothetical protein